MSERDWIEQIEKSKFVRLLKAISPVGVAMTFIGVVFATYNIWSGMRTVGDSRLDRAVEIYLSADSSDRRLPEALNYLVNAGYSLGPLDMPAASENSPLYMATVDFSWQNFSDSDLSGNDLSFANFEGTDLYGAWFVRAQLTWANFQDARLYNANLENADLACADLRFADIQGANFSGVNFGDPMGCQTKLDAEKLSDAFYFSDNPPKGLSNQDLNALQKCEPAYRMTQNDPEIGTGNRLLGCFLPNRSNSYPPRKTFRLWFWLNELIQN
ncbi:pentapeptide repeat-containing protein [Nisaea nitritireducens]|uniref:pentapeptide repeat-containing protein n=1 Tax=Nisaea nitritireducens TaxID=568392 RepID=UPI001866D646|nr:pentapeptide repeat-containing protein [Nisaea nitritireducens]